MVRPIASPALAGRKNADGRYLLVLPCRGLHLHSYESPCRVAGVPLGRRECRQIVASSNCDVVLCFCGRGDSVSEGRDMDRSDALGLLLRIHFRLLRRQGNRKPPTLSGRSTKRICNPGLPPARKKTTFAPE